MERTRHQSLSVQMKKKVSEVKEKEDVLDGDFGRVISSGSTLLDLNISGGRIRGGGIPGGILVEIFGPSGSGKTVLLSEIAGAVQREGGEIMFHDPEARLDTPFARLLGLNITKDNYFRPNTIPAIFDPIRKWEPKNPNIINGIFADSLAALSTDMEMSEEGDPYGTRRAKEFSEGLRKTCREIKDKNYLMVASNQIRDVIGATQFQAKTATPGGKAWTFYPSLRLTTTIIKKHKVEKKFAGKEISKIIGVRTEVHVYKSSIWEPYHSAPVTIIFDYGIDDLRENLQFIKDYSKHSIYTLGGEGLDKSLNESIKIVEEDNLEDKLKNEVIDLWEAIESEFKTERKPKR
jgi:RecA/RadA recombinase